MIRRPGILFSTLVLLFAIAACGGDGAPGTSPTSPTPTATNQPPATAGATLSGTVVGLAGATASGAVGMREVITVTVKVAGQTFTGQLNAQGQFVIPGLPGGTLTVSFTGTTATVTLDNVGPSDKIKIHVTISGGTAEVDAKEVDSNGEFQLEGRISQVVTANSFMVGMITVTYPAGALRRGDETPYSGTLKVGDRVHVKASQRTETTMTATLVIVQNTNPNVPVNIKGKVSGAPTGACPNIAFVVSGWNVVTRADSTTFKGACTEVVDKGDVHVKGEVQPVGVLDAGKVLATWVQVGK